MKTKNNMLCTVIIGLVVILDIYSMKSVEGLHEKRFKSVTSNFELKRWRRTAATDDSCAQSPIKTNVTLKGGIEAGYFRKLAQHVAMKLCIELCCEEKGCDVAFMSGKNCYGVQCFNEELCRAFPAKKNVTEPVMISHVTFKGEKVKTNELDDSLPKCAATKMVTGVTLRGGLHAGNFTDVGEVGNLSMCAALCCMSQRCDLALTINKNCFIVSCHSVSLCSIKKSLTAVYKPSVAFIHRKHTKTNATTPRILETSANQLVCKNSQIFHNTTLKGGYRAGNYTNFGKVKNISVCVRLCCGNKDCDAALMLENNCFAVACRDSDNCLPVHAKSSNSLAALNPRISYITSRSEVVSLADHLTPDGSCHAGIISYDVSLKGGANAGNFTPHGKVGSMEVCISKCCQIEGCSVAMMLKDTCFTVVCTRDVLCEKKQTPTSSDFNPKIAYVFRDKKKSLMNRAPITFEPHRNIKIRGRKKSLLAAQLHAITSSLPTSPSLRVLPSKSKLPDLRIQQTKLPYFHPTVTLPSNFNKNLNHSVIIPAKTNNTGNESALTQNTLERTILNRFLENNQHNEGESDSVSDQFQDCNSTSCENKTFIPLKESVFEDNRSRRNYSVSKSGLKSVDGDPGCTNSEVFHNVTLRGGVHSGKFKDRGEMEDINQCVKLCCLLERCDLAFMLRNTCFSVECYNETLCDAVPARSSIFSPTICYVYVKIAANVT